jgi:hypothetical protein
MKYSKYFGAKRRGFIKSESNLAPRGASHFKSENIRCDIVIILSVLKLSYDYLIHLRSSYDHLKFIFWSSSYHFQS